MKPIKIYEKLKLICKHLVHGRQEDAHEFLRYFFLIFLINGIMTFVQVPHRVTAEVLPDLQKSPQNR